jgi:hypothetical protein
MARDAYVAHLEKLISDEHLTASGMPWWMSCAGRNLIRVRRYKTIHT